MTQPALIKRGDWAREADQWIGKFEGGDVGVAELARRQRQATPDEQRESDGEEAEGHAPTRRRRCPG